MNAAPAADPHHLPAVPVRLARRPTTAEGLPIPWWVPTGEDGTPDFRYTDQGSYRQALDRGLCWVCGQPLGRFKAFVLFPTRALEGVSTHPPQHRDCALYAGARCPFMACAGTPRKQAPSVPSIGIVLVYVTATVHHTTAPNGITTILIGQPRVPYWFAGGRRLISSAQVHEYVEATRPAVLRAAKPGPAVMAVQREYDAVTKLIGSISTP